MNSLLGNARYGTTLKLFMFNIERKVIEHRSGKHFGAHTNIPGIGMFCNTSSGISYSTLAKS